MLSGVTIADLETLLKTKIATLVSRCSEKDFYDLIWLTEHYRFPDIQEWLQLGRSIDAGATAEAMLIATIGANLREAACGFAVKFGVSSSDVFEQIIAFRTTLQSKLVTQLEKAPVSAAIAPLIRELKKYR